MSAILNTKKMFIDTYGKVPPMIGFLGIDTDNKVFKDTVYTRKGEVVSLQEEELRRISMGSPKPVYQANQASLGWFPKGPQNGRNVRALQSLDRGAGQIRSNGRFAMWYYWKNVVDGIQKTLEKITDAKIVDNDAYDIWEVSDPEIHVVFSVCGGTGCGTFINLGYLLEEHIRPKFRFGKVVAYGVMPGVFKAMTNNGLENIEANTFGALEDMDWLMSGDYDRPNFLIESLNDTYYTNDSPYKVFMAVENRNGSGDVYRKISEISQMLSLALLTATSELSDAGASFYDNIVKNINEGDMDVAGKRAWVSGLGVSEITVHSETLGEIYAKKAAQKLINHMISGDPDLDAEARASKWIDSPDVNIRETDGRDAVVDFMLSAQPSFNMPEILVREDVEIEVNNWLSSVKVGDDIVQRKIKELDSRVKDELAKLFKAELNKRHGVKTAYDIFYSILSQIEACDKEMREELQKDEKEGLIPEQPILKSALESAENEYKNIETSFFNKKKRELAEKMSIVMDCANKVAVNEREIKRRNAAIQFYSSIKTELQNYLEKLKTIKAQLQTLYEKLEDKVAETKEHSRKYEQLFQIDLTKNFLDAVTAEINEDALNYFLNNYNLESIADAKSYEEVEEMFLSYTHTLEEGMVWASLSIDDVLNKMQTKELEEMIQRAIRKSSVLLNYDYELHGSQPSTYATEEFYIGVYDKTNSALKATGLVEKQLPPDKTVQYCNIGSTKSIIFYRQVGVVPPFTLPVLHAYKTEAEKAKEKNLNIHFDMNIEGLMFNEGYSIYPAVAADESLGLWVRGFLFGKIRNDGNGHYQYQDPSDKTRAMEGYWVNIPHPNPSMRDQAFAVFRDLMRDERKRSTFKEMIESEYKKMGEAAYEQLVRELKGPDVYFDKYSQIGLKKNTLEQHYYKTVKAQINDEVFYVQNTLQESI